MSTTDGSCHALAKNLARPRLLSSLKFRGERCGGRAVDLDLFWSPASVKRFRRLDSPGGVWLDSGRIA